MPFMLADKPVLGMFRVTRLFFHSFLPVLLPALCLSFCTSHRSSSFASLFSDSPVPYDLEGPSKTFALSNPDLKEISALSPTDQKGIFATIADEKGVVYFLDAVHGGAIVKTVFFRDKGDFEGIEMVGNEIWALKSDGKLFELSDWNGPDSVHIQIHETFLKKKNDVEGLCFDPKRNALLLACKENPDSVYARHVYAFDLNTKQLNPNPVFTIDPDEVIKLVPYGENDKHHAFSPSGIAIHPVTGDVYVISTALKRMVILDYNTGKIKAAARLDKQLLPQPEGIAFDPDGTLHLCSEGKSGDALLMEFAYQPK